MTACKEDKVRPAVVDPPVWQVNPAAGYYENMTAVVKIPSNLALTADENDQLAAFSEDDQCRGVGELINGVYFVSIKGVPEDQSNIRFKYYNAKNGFLYQTAYLFTFDADRMFGTADEPQVLSFTAVQQ